MDNFNLKQYISSKRLLKENIKRDSNQELIQHLTDNIEEVRSFLKNDIYHINDHDDEEEIEYIKDIVDEVEEFIVDDMGDITVSPAEIGISFKFPQDVDEDFKGENGDKPEKVIIGGKSVSYVEYNI